MDTDKKLLEARIGLEAYFNWKLKELMNLDTKEKLLKRIKTLSNVQERSLNRLMKMYEETDING